MKLNELILNLNVKKIIGTELDLEVTDIVYDSRKAKKDVLFVALVGSRTDGHKYIKDVEKSGVRAVVLSDVSYAVNHDVTYILVEDTRVALSFLSNRFFGEPSNEMNVIGITGTKGKTTVANYIKYVMDKSGRDCGIIGTNGIFYLDKTIETSNTTPESYEIHLAIRKMLDAGVKNIVMEVSSLGLMAHRVSDVDFDIGIFTNLSPDHIGENEHPDFENYMMSKAVLFSLAKASIINIDDEYAGVMMDFAKRASRDYLTYGIKNPADFRAKNISYPDSLDDMRTYFDIDFQSYTVNSFGEFGVYNALCTIICLKKLGLSYDEIRTGLSNAHVKGRLQILDSDIGVKTVIDYAHNEVSMKNLLSNIKRLKPKRIITVFGSIGTRAKHRRKELAEVSCKYSDVIIVTSDNPDTEDPQSIIDDVLSFVPKNFNNVFSFVDRQDAIKKAFEIAKPGDVVVIAGKGHEEYQLINGEKIYFSDYETAVKYLS